MKTNNQAKPKASEVHYWLYSTGNFANNIIFMMVGTYITYFYTNILGISPAMAGLVFMVARLVDAFTDPLMGIIVDKTNTKIGKYRPWILIGAICNAVVLFLLFTNFGMSGTKLYIYIGVMYILWGMTNTMADIPYWSMVPSFTSDPKDRNLVSTVARTFSGLGQGIITVATPIILPMLSTGMTTDKGYSATGFSRWAGICGIMLVLFSTICVLSTKEKNVVYGEKTKFSFKKIFSVIAHNDQLVVFMIVAMLSNAGWYLTSGTAVYYFSDVLGEPKAQSLFQTIGAVGSVLGLAVIPILSKWMNKKKIYQISLIATIIGYIMMYVFGPILKITIALDIAYIVSSTGIAAMFVGQTIFLADIVDYGEYKNGERNESITFSMKGFLQKMAYTIQTIVLFGGLAIMGYNKQITSATKAINESTKAGIGIICFAIPPILIFISLIVFTKKFKLHGELADKVHEHIVEKRNNEKA